MIHFVIHIAKIGLRLIHISQQDLGLPQQSLNLISSILVLEMFLNEKSGGFP